MMMILKREEPVGTCSLYLEHSPSDTMYIDAELKELRPDVSPGSLRRGNDEEWTAVAGMYVGMYIHTYSTYFIYTS